MNKKPEDPRSRHAALARLLAEALRARPAAAGAAEVSACPDAEILAAYADQGLAPEEITRWESHFADCGRCQKILATLAVSGEELSPAEVEKLGSIASVAPAIREVSARGAAAPAIPIRRRPMAWHWLVPAMGLAAAVALWFALHPAAPTPVLTSQKTAAEAPREGITTGAQPPSTATPGETQSAEANLPPPPAAAPPPAALLREVKPLASNSPAGAPESASKQEAFGNGGLTPAAPEAARSVPAPQTAARQDQVLSAQATPAQRAESNDAGTSGASPAAVTAAPSAVTPNPTGERPAPPAAAGAVGAVGGGIANGSFIPNRANALAKTATPPQIVIASPDRTALWRLGPGGRIERSTDGGQTWRLQASGFASDLLAGSAPSSQVAWVAGRAGTIARTTDGQTWQRVTPPPGPAQNWTGVEARDALHATITSRDLRRFATEDGGRTWATQP